MVPIARSATMRVQYRNDVRDYPLTLPVTYIGRAANNQIKLDEGIVSGQHAKLEWSAGVLCITDLNSAHGTRLNRKTIQPGVKHPLRDTDTISIGSSMLAVHYASQPAAQQPSKSQELALHGQSTVCIGRQPDNNVVISHPTVSGRHARVTWDDRSGTHIIEDLHSTNGTFVNGRRLVGPVSLSQGDIVQIGPGQLVYKLDRISAVDQSSGFRLDCLGLNRIVGRKNLLKNISLPIQPREFVAIVGSSGAGKSTLLHALSGYQPATSGAVLINGVDLYSNFGAYRSQIGFVPQSDIIHTELTVHEALDYSARLRLPSDTSNVERERRVFDVLDALGLRKCKDQQIHSLSGGEQKRVSIGVELLTEPGLFFLDEATSGLDPGTELEIMTLLRHLSDQGHTVVLVTHATRNLEKCHSVAILAEGGYLAYYGPPKEALGYFGVNDFDQIYAKLKIVLPKSAADRYLKSSECGKYLTARLSKNHVGQIAGTRNAATPGASSKGISSLRQFFVLSRRNFSVLSRDRVSLTLMLLAPPLISTLFFILWNKGLFEAHGGDARGALQNLFMVAMVCCLVGALSSMREIVKETDVYRRERMVVIRIVPYVLSKVLVCILLAAYSAAVFILFLSLSAGWPPPDLLPPVYATLVLSVLGGGLLGLCISALSPNANVAPLLLLLALVPQLLFGGIISANRMPESGRVIGYATTTKWTFESLVKISGMGDDVVDDPCWSLAERESDALTETEKADICRCMGENLFTECDFPGVQDYYVDEIDAPEPLKPASLGDPPADPQALSAYDEEMRQYQADIDTWLEDYQDWKEKRSRAIAEAEGAIRVVYDDYGQAFKARLGANWLVLSVIILVLCGLVLGTLKSRDRR